MESEIRFPFEKSEVYKKTLELARHCRKIASDLPGKLYSDADQLRRASLSACNNTAEGYGRWHKKDKKHFYTIARGSAYECVPVITLLTEESYIAKGTNQMLRDLISEVTKMLSGMIQGVDQRQ